MTDNGSFDFEDDDLFDDTFRNISDAELLNVDSANVLSESISSDHNADQSHIETKPPENITIASRSTEGSKTLNPNRSNLFQNHYRTIDSNQNFSHQSNVDTELFCTPKNNSAVSIEKTALINSRFTPGSISKVKKIRKFPGPYGVFYEINGNPILWEKSDDIVKKKNKAEIEVQDITNSHFMDDDLLLPSWQNLQIDVSSKSSLSTAKYYSICRVYNETAELKLPKHIIVPVLCVFLKKFTHSLKEPHSVFIDDTGEIKGKIDNQVLANFAEYLMDGVSFILKNITFMCNVLYLTEQNIVSIYLDDGTVKHIQEIDSVPCNEKLLKRMSCQCLATHSMKAPKNQSISNPSCDSSVTSENCINRSINNVPGNHLTLNTPPMIQKNCHSPKFTTSLTEKFSKSVPTASANVTSSKHVSVAATSGNSVCKGTSDSSVVHYSHASMTPKQCNSLTMPCSVSKAGHVSNDSNQAIVIETTNETNDLFDGNSDFDEFDELLGNLDEKSFLEEI